MKNLSQCVCAFAEEKTQLTTIHPDPVWTQPNNPADKKPQRIAVILTFAEGPDRRQSFEDQQMNWITDGAARAEVCPKFAVSLPIVFRKALKIQRSRIVYVGNIDMSRWTRRGH
jgi:hypothetical protein